MTSWRCIENIFSILIAIALVVGISLAVANIIGSVISKGEPRGASLIVAGARAEKVGQTILVEITGTVVGGDSILIDDVTVIYGGSNDSKVVLLAADPGDTINIRLSFNLDVPVYDIVNILITYCTQEECGSVITSATVMPRD